MSLIIKAFKMFFKNASLFLLYFIIFNNILIVLSDQINYADKEMNDGLQEQSFLYNIASVSENFGINQTDCSKHLKLFLEAIPLKEPWVLNMLDSSGQEEPGYLFTNFIWTGLMSQCKEINQQNNNLNIRNEGEFLEDLKPQFNINFVSVLLNHNNTMQMQLYMPNNEHIIMGLCLPASCTTNDVFQLLDQVLKEKKMLFLRNYPVDVSIAKIKSLADENNTWKNSPIVTATLGFLILTIILTTLGTIYDVNYIKPFEEEAKQSNSKVTNTDYQNRLYQQTIWSKILVCYSIPRNAQSLFDTQIKSEDSMPFVHGLKTLGMFYIVFVHFPLYISMTMHNISNCVRYSTAWYFQLFYKSAFSVDTYFCLGGFLISYLFYKVHRNKKQYTLVKGLLTFVQMITHRIIRLLPAYLVMLGSVVTIWRWMEHSYPLFRLLDAAEEICPIYWWRNLLFITTWFPRSDMCITWTWYLSEDMQFYIVNCALLLISTVYLKPTIYFMKFLVLYSIVYTGWKSYNLGFIPTSDAQMRVEEMYYSFSIRMAPYFVGVLTGFYFNKWEGKLPISQNAVKKMWYLFILNAIYLVHSLSKPNMASFAFNTFYVATSRTFWGIGIAWMLIACLSGHGGIIQKFMSFIGWIPFSRTTFCVYLTNVMIVNLYGYTGEGPSHFSITHQIIYTSGNIAFCFVIGLTFSLLFESPFVKLIKLGMRPGKKNTEKVDQEETKNNVQGAHKTNKIKSY